MVFCPGLKSISSRVWEQSGEVNTRWVIHGYSGRSQLQGRVAGRKVTVPMLMSGDRGTAYRLSCLDLASVSR